MADIRFTGELTSVNNTNLNLVDNYVRNIVIENASPSPMGFYNLPTVCDSNPEKWISLDNCTPQTLHNTCFTSNNVPGRCNTSNPTNNTCIYRCVPDIVRNTVDIPTRVRELETYWQNNQSLMNLEYVDNTQTNPHWVISPMDPNVDIVCSKTCQDTNSDCNNPPTVNMDSFCSQGTRNTDCCVCNETKWSRQNYFVGETMPDSYEYGTNDISDTIPDDMGTNIQNIFDVPKPTKLGYKKIKKGYIKPYYIDGTNLSANNCYIPLPAGPLSYNNPPTIDSYRYRDELLSDNRNQYAFAIPRIRTFNSSVSPIEVNLDSDIGGNPMNYFYHSSPTSVLGKKGYYEECFYGPMINGACPTKCPKDMINPTHIGISPSYPMGKNTVCERCPQGEGKISDTSNTCFSCNDINKITDPTRGYGCLPCENNHYFDKNTSTCSPCLHTDKVLTMCENKQSRQCPNPTYAIDLSQDEKDNFYNTCFGSNDCQVTEKCIYKPSNSHHISSDINSIMHNTILPTPKVITNNLYMHEVCKTIDTQLECDLVSECKWFDGIDQGVCYLNFPSPLPDNLFVPMSVPPNISDPNIVNQLNAFSTPSPDSTHCLSTDTGVDHSVGEYWGSPILQLPQDKVNCSNIPSIRLPNLYTNSELNTYALPQTQSGISECKYYGCVDIDKYYQTSIPETVYQSCEELKNVYTDYDVSYVVKPSSLSDLVDRSYDYGCQFLKNTIQNNIRVDPIYSQPQSYSGTSVSIPYAVICGRTCSGTDMISTNDINSVYRYSRQPLPQTNIVNNLPNNPIDLVSQISTPEIVSINTPPPVLDCNQLSDRIQNTCCTPSSNCNNFIISTCSSDCNNAINTYIDSCSVPTSQQSIFNTNSAICSNTFNSDSGTGGTSSDIHCIKNNVPNSLYNNQVSVEDLLKVLSQFGGPPQANNYTDINRDGTINVEDLLLVLSYYGTSCNR